MKSFLTGYPSTTVHLRRQLKLSRTILVSLWKACGFGRMPVVTPPSKTCRLDSPMMCVSYLTLAPSSAKQVVVSSVNSQIWNNGRGVITEGTLIFLQPTLLAAIIMRISLLEGDQNDPDNFHDGFKGRGSYRTLPYQHLFNLVVAFLMRGLHTAWSMNDPASDISQLISAYITAQVCCLSMSN
jgi:hypothetical protein